MTLSKQLLLNKTRAIHPQIALAIDDATLTSKAGKGSEHPA
jgi:hypothetical protein